MKIVLDEQLFSTRARARNLDDSPVVEDVDDSGLDLDADAEQRLVAMFYTATNPGLTDLRSVFSVTGMPEHTQVHSVDVHLDLDYDCYGGSNGLTAWCDVRLFDGDAVRTLTVATSISVTGTDLLHEGTDLADPSGLEQVLEFTRLVLDSLSREHARQQSAWQLLLAAA